MTLYDRIAAIYDPWSKSVTEDVAFYVDAALASGGPVVELAVGTGRIAVPIAKAGVRVIGVDTSPEMLRRAAEYVNREFSGLPIDAVRAAIIARLQEARGLYDHLMKQAFAMAERALAARTGQQALFVDGTASLIAEAQQQHGEVSLGTLRALVEMIEEKQRLVHLLSEYLDTPGLAIVIGTEHSLPDLKPFSLIAASYLDGSRGRHVGHRVMDLCDGNDRVRGRYHHHGWSLDSR